MAGYAFPKSQLPCQPPPIRPTPRFPSPVPGPKKSRKKNGAFSSRKALGGTSRDRKVKLGNINKKTKSPAGRRNRGGTKPALSYVSNWSEFLEFRNGQCRDGTVDVGGGTTLLDGPPSMCSKITLPPTIGKRIPEDGRYGIRAGRKGQSK